MSTISAAQKTRKGLLGTKLGMTQVWDAANKLIPVTVIEVSPNVEQLKMRLKGIDVKGPGIL